MSKEQIKLRINNLIEVRKYLSTYVLVLSGGLITLFLGDFSVIKVILFIVGGIFDAFLISAIIKQNSLIDTLIGKVED